MKKFSLIHYIKHAVASIMKSGSARAALTILTVFFSFYAYSMIFPTPPDAVDDVATTTVNSSVDIDVLANDIDINGGMSLLSVTTPDHGSTTINGDNTVSYVPDVGYQGGDSFDYVVTDGTDESEIQLNGSVAVEGDKFGISVDAWGDLIAAGASTSTDGSVSRAGLAYVFRRSGSAWIEEDILSPADPSANAEFGKDVDIHDDLIAVGAYQHNQGDGKKGAVYLYRFNGSSWAQEARLEASDGDLNDQFGRYLGIYEETVVVAAWANDDAGADSGSAYVFEKAGSTWVEQAKLTASDAVAGDQFGRSIDIEGDVIVIGAKEASFSGVAEVGAVYVFRKQGANWVEEQKIVPTDFKIGDEFGNAVAVEGNTLVIGSWRDDDMGSASGSVYLYEWNGASWEHTSKLTADDGLPGDRFGTKLDISGNLIVVSAELSDLQGTSSGSAYLFQKNGNEWIQFKKYLASNGVADDNFGDRIAVGDNTVIVGASPKDNLTGTAYVYPVGSDVATVNVSVDESTGPNGAPTLDSIGDQSVDEGDAKNVSLSGTDPDGNGLAFSAIDLPSFAQLTDYGDGTARLRLTPGLDDSGSVNVTVMVTDNGSPPKSDSETFAIVVANTNQAPELSSIGDQAVVESGSKSVALSATDADGDSLSFSAQGLPDFMMISDNGDNTASIEINARNAADNGLYTITVAVGDDGSPMLTDEETIDIVVGSSNVNPVLASIGSRSLDVGSFLSVSLSATDANGDTLTFDSTALPPFAQLTDNGDGTGTLALTPGLGDSGDYPITIQVSDNGIPALSDDESIIVTVNPVTGGGTVQGGLMTASSAVDLTSEGSVDWVHFGLAFGEWLTRKAGATPLISDYTPVAGSAVSSYVSTKIGYTWSDGTPSASVTNTKTGLRVYNVGEGFEISVPADTTAREVTFYVGAKESKGRLEATLSDGSAAPYILEINKQTGKYTQAATITYQAAFDNQTLLVRYTMDTAYLQGSSTISIEAATISGSVTSTNSEPELALVGNRTLTDDEVINIPLSATDTNGDALSFSTSLLPSFMSLTDNGNGTANISVMPSQGDAGAYPVTITVADDGDPILSDSEMITVSVNATNGSGTIQGSSEQAPAVVDLTSDGPNDWAHFGLQFGEWFTHKSGVTSLISDYTVLGGGVVNSYSSTKTAYTWSDGIPTVSKSESKTGLRVFGVNEGFQISLPADLTSRRVTFYLGVKEAAGRFEATLSDGSALPYVVLVDKSSGKLTQAITVIYEAESAGQFLNASFTMDTSYSAGSSISLESVTAAGASPSNNAPTLTPVGNQTLADDSTVSVPLLATDLDNDNVSFTASGLPAFAWVVDNGDGSGSLEIHPSAGDAGLYPVTIIVTDDGVPVMTTEESITIQVNSTSGGGDVQGSSVKAVSSINLSDSSHADWAHYGLMFGEWFTHKAGVTSEISDYSTVGGAVVNSYQATKSSYSWGDGTPSVTTNNSQTGLRVFGVGEGFQVSVPAGIASRTATFYVGVKKAVGHFEARLSDGSSVPYVELIDKSNGKLTQAVTVNYHAASEGQSLIVTFSLDSTYAAGSGSVSLESVTTAVP